ncbi:redoxin domain-containing protein [Amphibacillus cookii]|uniref:redoxin domain-containing protein n=1 Tax=Amphibacillus cookii TaxID=767787 RepID=UPI001959E1A9|nr:redoxin domain-containing protein [Amphibacillus cookii]MBM7540339.1 peroxiredoxin [Amphibacillus cookii]
MKKILLLAAILIMFGWAVYDYITDTDDPVSTDSFSVTKGTEIQQLEEEEGGSVGINIGDQAPPFELETLTGETITLADYQGKAVMLNFWATWCPPCRAEMPDMEKFYQSHEVEILAVNLTPTESSENDVESFVQDYGLNFNIPLDKEGEVSSLYAIRPVPTTFMIDSNGIIQQRVFGALNYDQMVQALREME